MLVKVMDGKKEIVFNCISRNLDGSPVDLNDPDDWKRVKSRIVQKYEAIGYGCIDNEDNKEHAKAL